MGEPRLPQSGHDVFVEWPRIPRKDADESLDLFQRSEIVRGAFGAPFQEVFSRLKQAERSNFERIVTPLDYLWYARVA
jgi:glutamine synthetase